METWTQVYTPVKSSLLASALVAHARETADMVFLSSGDDDVARVYERVGFRRQATACTAEPA